MDKLRSFISSHKDLVVYFVVGILTTIINYTVYFLLFNLLSVSPTVCNIIAWVIAVAFAFVTNKIFVFKSKKWSPLIISKEVSRFLACRIGSVALETLIIYLATSWADLDGNLIKIVTGVLVIVFNYFGSKLIVFPQTEKGG